MISTVTTAVSTIVTSSATSGLLASLGAAGVLTLISALVMKELAMGEGVRLRLFGRNLDVAIIPLLFVFWLAVAMQVWGAFS